MIKLIIVGVGGTGAYASNYLAQHASVRSDIFSQIILCDGDRVEEKNIERQPYFSHEVGKFKADLQAKKLSAVYPNLKCLSYPRFLENEEQLLSLCQCSEEEVPLVIGCVDNAHARILMHNVFHSDIKDILYLDSGNEEFYGNIKLGAKVNGKVVAEPIGNVFPDLIEPGDYIPKSHEHCHQNIASGKQRAGTNQMAAVLINLIVNSISDCEPNTETIFFDTKTFVVTKI